MGNENHDIQKRSRFESICHILKSLWWVWLLIILAGIILKLFYLIIAGASFLIVCGLIILFVKLALSHDNTPSDNDS